MGERVRGHRRRVLRTLWVPLIVVSWALMSASASTGRPAVESTEAAWLVGHGATATVTAGRIPKARLTHRCAYDPGVLGLGAHVKMYWAPPQGYEPNDAVMLASQSGLGSVLAPLTGFDMSARTLYEARNNRYVTSVPTRLLGGLLGLGTELELSIVMQRRGWTSEGVSVATNAGLVAGIGASCRNLS